MPTLENRSIANEIRSQLGSKALFMIGAKNLIDHGNALSFKIGRNSKSINYIKITLTSLDLYDVEYGWLGAHGYKVRETSAGLYNDMLRRDIEKKTGLYTSL